MGRTIDLARARLENEEKQNRLGLDNDHNITYWAAYMDGAIAQFKEDMRTIEDERKKYRELAIQVLKEKE